MYNYKAIVLSGPPVSGKSTLANILSREYNLPLYSVGQMWREKWRTLYPKGDITFEIFWNRAKELMTNREKMAIDADVKELCEKGNVIVDSRFAAMHGGDIGLRIFVTADFKVRLLRAGERENYKLNSAEELRIILQSREEEEVKLGKELYGLDYRDPVHYHIVLNTDMLTINEEFDIVSCLMGISR